MRKYRVPKRKIKRYYGAPTSFRRGPRPFVVAAVILGIILLVTAGVLAYRPIYNAVMEFGESLRNLPESSLPESLSSPESDSEAEPQSEPEPESKPALDNVSAVLLSREIAADTGRLDEFLASLPDGTTAVMFDIKNSDGEVQFQTVNEQAMAWEAVAPDAIELNALADALAQRNLRLIARIYAFRDPLAAAAGREECAVMYEDTDHIWIDAALDAGGKPWLNPYLANVREYISSLAREAVEQGADMIVLDGARFPDASRVQANFGPESETVSRAEMLVRFLDEFSAALGDVRVAVGLPVFDIASQANWDVRYGGSPLDLPLPAVLLDVTPGQFGEGFSESGLTVTDPAGEPAAAASAAAEFARTALAAAGRAPELLLALREDQLGGAHGLETVTIERGD